MAHLLSVGQFLPKSGIKSLVQWFVPLLDRLLGIKELNKRYQTHGFYGLQPAEFTRRFVDAFQLRLNYHGDLSIIPSKGKLIIVANHPFGGVEGVALIHLLSQIRPDIKVLANRALAIFPELSPYFIYTNPLQSNASGNVSSLKLCYQHLDNDGVLLLFPAGRVSASTSANQPITDHPWHNLVGGLIKKTQAPVLPLFIVGKNRPIFYQLGHIYYRLRMFMLIREMLHSEGKSIDIYPQNIVQAKMTESKANITGKMRLLTYLTEPTIQQHWPSEGAVAMQPLAAPQDVSTIVAELAKLPSNQQLLRYKNYTVYFAYHKQIPTVVAEIQRLREKNFRVFDEGSGEPKDGDNFDLTYTHLFVYDHTKLAIIGAYRMGQTDKLLAQSGNVDNLYLSQMFEFQPTFVNQTQPCLEMGRSFVDSEAQRSFHGLLLLFKGIGAFVCQFPRYRVLYGTVSLSRQYRPLSVLLMQHFLANPSENVQAKLPFTHPIPLELTSYLAIHGNDIESLNWLIQQIEPDGKGIPVLVKQYYQLGARFYCVGIDGNFATTPGFLIQVDLAKAPKKLLSLYLGDGADAYLASDTV